MEFCRVHDNLDEGLEVRSSAQPLLHFNRIEDNGFGLRNDTPLVPVDARQNWWGDASGPYHPTLNPGGLGDQVSDGVLFDPWLGPYAYVWKEPDAYLLHGKEMLSWFEFAAGEPAARSVGITTVTGGQTYTLGLGLPTIGELAWDTTGYPDGLHELHALFRNGEGQVIADIAKTIAVNNSPAIAWHGGRLTANETWNASKVHVVEKDLFIPASVTLTVEPRAIVKFERGAGITVEDGGTLATPATEAEPIVFTSLADDSAGGDTNMDGDYTLPIAGDWRGIAVQGAGQFFWNQYVELRYVLVTHSGTLSADQTWYGHALHRITGNLIIPAGVTLTIQPGAIVKFDTPVGSKLGITVNAGGTLNAQGTVARPIVFTSMRDDAYGGDSNGDGNASLPSAGDWRWLYIEGQATLNHAVLAYGAGTASGNWDQTGVLRTSGNAVVTLANSIVHEAFFDGVLAWGGPVTIENCLFTAADRAIAAHPGSVVDVVNSTLDDNRVALLIHGGTLNAANTLATNSFDCGVQYDFGTVGSLTYNDVWSTMGTNYCNMTDPTGTDGNLSTDPVYRDRAGADFRLQYLSPVIDAADGGLAPESDFMGAPRYDDPRSPNTGLPTPGGEYADMGAFEFVETADSNIDLVVSAINGPAQGTAGEVIYIEWTVANAGPPGEGEGAGAGPDSDPNVAVGPWHDTIALALGPDANSQYLFAAEVLVGDGLTLGPGESATFDAEVRVPGGTAGDYRWQITTNTRGEVFEGVNSANNAALSVNAVKLDVPSIPVGGAVDGEFPAAKVAAWSRLQQSADEEVLLTLDTDAPSGRVVIYAGVGGMPTAQDYDHRSLPGNSPDVDLILPAPAYQQTVYLLLMPESLPGSDIPFNLSADAVAFDLRDIGLARGANLGPITIALYGSRFGTGLSAQLYRPGTTIGASQVAVQSSGLALATFDLTGAPLGTYDVTVSLGGYSATLPAAFTVIEGVPGELLAELVLPMTVRLYRPFVGAIEFQNVGDVDMPIPLLTVEGDDEHLLWTANESESSASLTILAAPDGVLSAGVLRPGERHSFTFYSTSARIGGFQYTLSSKAGNSSQTVDWDALRSAIRPNDPDPLWDDAWQALTDEIGDTYADYITALAEANDEAVLYDGGCDCELPSRLARELLGYLIERQMVRLPSAVLTGSVTSGGQPLARTPILLLDTQSKEVFAQYTWFDGTFAFHNPPEGIYDLQVSGYQPDPWGQVTVPSGTPLEVEVMEGNILQGHVIADGSGLPIAGAAVTAQETTHGWSYTGYSDSDGLYRIGGLVEGTYEVAASTQQVHLPSASHTVEMTGNLTVNLSFELAEGLCAYGEVVDQYDQPLEGALVIAEWQDGLPEESYVRAALTENLGHFYLDGLREGQYKIRASADGYGAAILDGVSVTFRCAELNPLSLSDQAIVAGFVEDLDTGLPIEGAEVWSNATSDVVTTDSLGGYSLGSLPPLTMTVSVLADAYQPAKVTLVPEAGQTIMHSFALTPTGTFSGVVELAVDGSPLAGVRVVLANPYGIPLTVTTDVDGSFAFVGLLDGEYAVAVGDALGTGVTRLPFSIGPAQRQWEETISLDAATLSGQVLAADGVTPIPGAGIGLVSGGALLDTAIGDSDGQYHLLVFQSGTYDLVAWDHDLGIQWLEGVEVVVGQHLTGIDLLGGEGEIVVTVTSAPQGNAPVEDATVVLRRTVGGLPADASVWSFSGADGQVVFDHLSSGDYQVEVQAAGLASQWQAVTLSGGSTPLDVSLQSGLVLQGMVSDASGAPAVDVRVTVLDPAHGAAWLALTDEDGAYSLDNLPQGVYDVWFIDPAYAPLEHAGVYVWGPGAETKNALLATEGVTLTGAVYSSAGQPVWGAAIQLVGDGDFPIRTVYTDQSGVYILPRLPQGEQGIRVHASGFPLLSETVILPGSGQVVQDFTLEAVVSLDLPPASGARAAGESPFLPEGFGASVKDYANFLMNSWFPGDKPPQENADAAAMCLVLRNMPAPDDDDCWQRHDAYWKARAACSDADAAFGKWYSDYRNWENQRAVMGAQAVTQAVMIYAKLEVSMVIGALQKVGAPIQTVQFLSTMGTLASHIGSWIIAGDVDMVGISLDNAIEYCEAQKMSGPAGFLGTVSSYLEMLRLADELLRTMPSELTSLMNTYQASEMLYDHRVRQVQAAYARFRDMKDCEEDEEEPPEPDPTEPEDEQEVDTDSSWDPNDKLTIGYGPMGFVDSETTILYTIRFENVITATAAAQQVTISDPLPASLDWATVELVAIAFNDVNLILPPGRSQYQTVAHVGTDPYPVLVQAAMDMGTGTLTWLMHSFDPVTGELPEDPLAGFLPPNDETGRGEGYVIFEVRPFAGLADGTSVLNQAQIVFDVNPPIDTPVVANTIDDAAPTSTVQPLPPTSPPSFTVNWSGNDGSGSGIKYYDVYVSTDGGSFELWQARTTQTQAVFSGVPDRTYGFYCVATDNVGHRQPTPDGAQASTTTVFAEEFLVYLPLVARHSTP
jgi:uncharacterized repeat protein (TIGR01451 family)